MAEDLKPGDKVGRDSEGGHCTGVVVKKENGARQGPHGRAYLGSAHV